MRFLSLVTLAFLFSTSPALAAGLYTPDLGAASLGKGAADIAAPSSLTAIYYNPAALAEVEGLRLLLDVRGMSNQVSMQRASNDPSRPYAEVSNEGSILPAPTLGISYGWKSIVPFAVALGMNGAPGYTGDRYPDFFAIYEELPEVADRDGAAAQLSGQRYQIIEQNTRGINGTLSLAAQVLPNLSLGAQLIVPFYHFNLRRALSLNSVAYENPGYDAELTLDAKNDFQVSGAFSATASLPYGIRVGGSFQLPTTIVGKGTMKIVLPEWAEEAITIRGDKANIKIRLPWIGRLGARLDRDLYSVELAGVYEAWSRYRYVTLTPQDIYSVSSFAETKLSRSRLDTGMQNAGSVRLGGELRLGQLIEALANVRARAGVIYETSAVPLEYTSVMATNWERVIPTLGLGIRYGMVDFDLAYAHAFAPERKVENSKVLMTSRLDSPPPVGNGSYSTNIDLLAMSIGVRL